MAKTEKKPENPAKALLPPQHLEAEQSVLGAILLRAVGLDALADLLGRNFHRRRRPTYAHAES